jgi:hypothetical protein
MDASRFDSVSKLLARHRFSRRQALKQGGAGLAAAAGLGTAGLAPVVAQEATPVPEPVPPDAEHGPTMLFVQSFQSGSIAPKEGEDGRYTVTLEHGLGQTIYFSDRPDRIVGASPTPQFLEGLGFFPDNPPNAALVVETAPGETDIAVVELFNPLYDPTGPTVTYEVAVLENWEDSTELGFTAAPADLAALAPSFGAAHLFIDDCGDWNIECYAKKSLYPTWVGTIVSSDHDGWCYSWWSWQCLPCQPWNSTTSDAQGWWNYECGLRFPDSCPYGCWADGTVGYDWT